MSLRLLSTAKCFEGEQRVYSHISATLDCEMTFGVYMPPAAVEDNTECPVLYFLSGLTCTHENFIQKSGVQKYAAKHGLVVVNPDTSPRNLNIAGQDDDYAFGSSAGFYVNATEAPWSKNYKMYDYVTKELIELINSNLPVLPNRLGIFGHSMGGHGALICALKNPGLYKSVSAFAPICNPVNSPWGKKAFTGYLGEDIAVWQQWDATELAGRYSGTPVILFIDQGSGDDFFKRKELLPENLLIRAEKNENIKTIFKLRGGYDHSYFHIATFIEEHLEYHAKLLKT